MRSGSSDSASRCAAASRTWVSSVLAATPGSATALTVAQPSASCRSTACLVAIDGRRAQVLGPDPDLRPGGLERNLDPNGRRLVQQVRDRLWGDVLDPLEEELEFRSRVSDFLQDGIDRLLVAVGSQA